jgi:hypothetical protein
MKNNSFFYKLLGSGTGVSSKRFIGFIAAVTMIFVAVVDLFSNNTVSEYVFDGLKWLAIAGLGFVASEKFADVLVSKNKDVPTQQTPPTDNEQPIDNQ